MTPPASSGHPGMITGLFRDKESAERAYRAAVELGYESDDINLIMSDETRDRHFAPSPPASAPEETDLADKATDEAPEASESAHRLGGPIGGTAGTLAPVLGVVGALLLIPGLVFAGPLAVALAAAGAVGVAGGLVGALTDWGIPRKRVEEYEAGIREGGILIGVQPRSKEDARRLQQEWSAAGGELVHA